MSAVLQSIVAWYDGRPLRERIILAAAAMIAALSLFEGLWWGPQRERTTLAERAVHALETQKATLALELDVLEQRESEDPDAAIRGQLDLLAAKIDDLDERLRGQTLQILAPEQMTAVLRDMVDSIDGMRITGIRSEMPQRLVNGTEDNLPVLWRHGLVIDLQGDYLGLLDCVRKLEELPWRLYWLGMEVEAHGFEPGEFRLHVYTVSLREEWIRV